MHCCCHSVVHHQVVTLVAASQGCIPDIIEEGAKGMCIECNIQQTREHVHCSLAKKLPNESMHTYSKRKRAKLEESAVCVDFVESQICHQENLQQQMNELHSADWIWL